MAVTEEDNGAGITDFDQWYTSRSVNERTGCIEFRGLIPAAARLLNKFRDYKREMDARAAGFADLMKLANGEVVSRKPDLPNVSSGETAGIIRRIARNLVQNAPNVEVISQFDDDSLEGVLARHILLSKIIGSEQYSNDMQQNLFASTKTALTIGFDCVIPCLLEDAGGSWYFKYNVVHSRDVFPEPGCIDVRDATEVFIRRYLTLGEVKALIRNETEGWDIAALKELAVRTPVAPAKEAQSNAHLDTTKRVTSSGYEIITWYSSSGANFLTFAPTTGMLLRIEKNNHPLKWHPVFFLVLEKDSQQPLGKSQVELLFGRQEFQDLMHNGAMKLWYRNINPSIIGYGTVNSIPNLSPGKYTPISNPNAKIEPFEVNTQTLMQFTQISSANLGSMVNLVGAADQQMATQSGSGMSATPQGVEAQQAMVDITTNNYQKAIEAFISKYCSYALTLYFQELKAVKSMKLNADTRTKLIDAATVQNDDGTFSNVVLDALEDDGTLKLDFQDMAVEYFVRCVPGSLVEMEDDKQLRILNQLFIPLSQALPAMAATQNQDLLQKMAATMQFIVETEIELSGSNRSKQLSSVLKTGKTPQFLDYENRIQETEDRINGINEATMQSIELTATAIQQMQEQIKILGQTQQALVEKLGGGTTTHVSVAAPDMPQQPTQQVPAA